MRVFRTLFSLIFIMSLAHGIWLIWQYQHQHWRESDYNNPLTLTGSIASIPQPKNHGIRFLFQTTSGLIQLNWYTPFPQNLQPGEVWQLTAKLKPNDFTNNPGEFDYGRYLKQNGILASGYVMTKPAAHLLRTEPWHYPLQTLRAKVYQRIINATNTLNMQGVLVALILGDKSLLNQHQQAVFENSGTTYFMVISGLHIVLFAMLCGLIARYLWCLIPGAALKIPAPKIALVVGLIAGLLYSLLAGFLIPTQRALWMLWLMGLAKLFYTRVSTITLLLLAGIIVLAWDPLAIYSIAFWLSFIAVFFLIYIMSSRYQKLSHLENWIYPQWVMYVSLMPILVFVFQKFSIVSVLTNFIAIPFMMLGVIPLALLGGIMVFINFQLGQFLFLVSDAIMRLLFMILNWGVNLPHALIVLPAPTLLTVSLAVMGCLIVFAPRGIPLRFAGFLLLLPLLFPKPDVGAGAIKTTHLNVANGEVMILQTQNQLIIEQTVTTLPEAKATVYHAILPYLQQQGISRVHLWIINGLKNYHALQSLRQSAYDISVTQFMVPTDFKIFDSTIESCDTNQKLDLAGKVYIIDRRNGICSIQPFV